LPSPSPPRGGAGPGHRRCGSGRWWRPGQPGRVPWAAAGGELLVVETVEVELAVELEHRGGTAHLVGALHLSGAGDDVARLYDVPPVASGPLEVSGEGRARLAIAADAARHRELVAIFGSGAVHVGVALYVDALARPEAVDGTWQIVAIDAEVTGIGSLTPVSPSS
jgi:hypothetical protein